MYKTTAIEDKIILFYLYKNNNRYLTKFEISELTKLNYDDVNKIITEFETKEGENYQDLINKRREYYENIKQKRFTEYLDLIKLYCGEKDKPLSISAIAKMYDLEYLDAKIKIRNALLYFLKRQKLLLEMCPNIYDNFYKRCVKLGIIIKIDDNINRRKEKEESQPIYDDKILKALYLYQNNKLTIDNIIALGFKDIKDFFTVRTNFYRRILENPNKDELIDKYNKSYSIDLESLLNQDFLTFYDYLFVETICRFDGITVDELLKLTLPNGNKLTAKAINCSCKRIFDKIKRTPILSERIKLLIPSFSIDKFRNINFEFTVKETDILKTINDNYKLNDSELCKILGYVDVNHFKRKKKRLMEKIRADYYLSKKVKLLFPNVDVYEEQTKHFLNEGELKILQVYNNPNQKRVNDENLALRLGFSTYKEYIYAKKSLFKKIRSNEQLKREALMICPTISSKMHGICKGICFTNQEIFFLQNFCLVRENNLINQSIEVIATNLNVGVSETIDLKKACYNKVSTNISSGANIEALLWPNFLEEFIIVSNLDNIDSVNLENMIPNYTVLKHYENEIREGVKRLENSIYKDFVYYCTYPVKAMLAFKLGFFNNNLYTNLEMKAIFGFDDTYINPIVMECVNSVNSNYITKKILTK